METRASSGGNPCAFRLDRTRICGTMVPMPDRATSRRRVTCRIGRFLALLSLLLLLVLQPFGALALVLHDHDDGDHVHFISGEAAARYVSGERGWHAERHGDLEAGCAHQLDRGGPLETNGFPGTLIVLNTSDAYRVYARGSVVQKTTSVARAEIPRWQMPSCRDVVQLLSPPPRWQNHLVSRRSGIAEILLRNHALLL